MNIGSFLDRRGNKLEKQILVVEDDEILNSGLCYNLQKRGIVPFSAYSIEEAEDNMKKETVMIYNIDTGKTEDTGIKKRPVCIVTTYTGLQVKVKVKKLRELFIS